MSDSSTTSDCLEDQHHNGEHYMHTSFHAIVPGHSNVYVRYPNTAEVAFRLRYSYNLATTAQRFDTFIIGQVLETQLSATAHYERE